MYLRLLPPQKHPPPQSDKRDSNFIIRIRAHQDLKLKAAMALDFSRKRFPRKHFPSQTLFSSLLEG